VAVDQFVERFRDTPGTAATYAETLARNVDGQPRGGVLHWYLRNRNSAGSPHDDFVYGTWG
jgi:hypothetical protein